MLAERDLPGGREPDELGKISYYLLEKENITGEEFTNLVKACKTAA